MDCSDILKQGIFNIIEFKSYEKSEDRFYEWVKQVDETTARNATAAGLDLTIPAKGVVVPLKGDFSHDEWNAWSKHREKITEQDITRTVMLDNFSRVADAKLVEAWLQCMQTYLNAQKDAGLTLAVEVEGENIAVTAQWKVNGGAPPANVQDWQVSNADLTAGKVPTKLNEGVAQMVTYARKDPDRTCVVSIQTDRGALLQFVPARVVPKPDTPMRTGQNFGAVADVELELTVPMDQTVRIWGGCVAAYQQPGNPTAQAWVYEGAKGGPTLWASPEVTMGLNPDLSLPYVTLHGEPFRGNLVGSFDISKPVKRGDKLKYVGHTSNYHASAVAFLLFIDYTQPPP